MPVDELHGQVATIVLRAAARHGFALAGGNALIAHGVINRRTEDVDVFTDQERGVAAASAAVERALAKAGFRVEKQDKAGGLGDMFPEMKYELAEWLITAPGGRKITLQLSYFDRRRGPVPMEFGPVLHLDDAAATKTNALVNRADPRDYVDLAALLERYSIEQLLAMARELDPGLEEDDITSVGQRLDRLPDSVFLELYELGPQAVAQVRKRFEAWPRPQARRRRT
jgi:Nucleotidyl transferase AbiEii toxin, Type IV TA system